MVKSQGIRLSNGYILMYVVASGALAFDGRGWLWERLLVWLGLIRPELFAVTIKSLTRYPRQGNLHWWKPWTWLPFSPWSCVRFVTGGAVNKVGLTNPGVEWWCREIGPRLDYKKQAIIGSIFGDKKELVEMALMLNEFDLVALEINVSCPNTGHAMDQVMTVIHSICAVKNISRHPIIVKLSVDQDYLAIAEGLVEIAEAISLNSVPWATAFPNGEQTPLAKLEQRIGGGGGGVSGKPAQQHNWTAVAALAKQGLIPVIGPSIMELKDIETPYTLGARAISFGVIHLRTPWKPTVIVKQAMKES